MPDISLADIDWRRAVIQNVDTLASLAACRNVLDVLGVSGPHLTKLVDQCHRKFVTLIAMILIVRGHINAWIPRCRSKVNGRYSNPFRQSCPSKTDQARGVPRRVCRYVRAGQ